MLRKLLDGKITAEPLVEGSRRGFRLAGRLNVGHLHQREVFTMFERAQRSTAGNSETVVAATGTASEVREPTDNETDDFRLPFTGVARLGRVEREPALA